MVGERSKGGHLCQISATYNTVLKSLPRKLNHSSHLGSCDTNNPHDDQRNDYPSDGWFDLGHILRRGFVPFAHHPEKEGTSASLNTGDSLTKIKN